MSHARLGRHLVQYQLMGATIEIEARGDMGDVEVYGEWWARYTIPYWAYSLDAYPVLYERKVTHILS